ncbi:hypothetical protein A4G99_11490 [Haladaptatus sp. R4]|uniref:DUF5820 family protein n=1 Tax=unclassified Haladaptatus TaxID=2622732 RepID=UPI0007B4D1AF|nr:DUF5820 family protein [Haladaptatus sp. R4]KZN23524.1 hypothetical protein A4G99_11490 [Haladaptatus sp. R4]
MSIENLPESWVVWNEEPNGRCILAYRPDVFDTQQFPSACMPTLYVTQGTPNRPPQERRATDSWYFEFFLEPEVTLPGTPQFPAREEAITAAVSLAAEFDRGEVDYRSCYQVPRERYLDKLDELTGREA